MTDIDFRRLRSLTVRRLVSGLERDGFLLDSRSSGHRQYRHADGRRVTVSFHSSRETFAPKILRIMLEKQAKWSQEDCERFGLF